MIARQQKPQKSTLLERIHFYLYIITFAFVFVGLFTLPKGHEAIEILVILSFSFGIINLLVNRNGLTRTPILWVGILFAGAFVIHVNHYIHGDWGRYGRAFLYMGLFVLLRPRIPCIKQVVFYSVAIGGILLGVLSLYQFKNGLLRVEGFTNAILFSQALLVLVLINMYYFLCRKDSSRFLALVSMCFLFVGLYLSQTRGVWLALLLLVFFYILIKAYKKPLKYLLIALALIVIAFSTYGNSGFVRDKVASGISDLNRAKSGQFASSWGLRLVAWDSAIKGIRDNPLLGVGRDGFSSYKEQQVERGEVNELILHPGLKHTHNQYLQSQLIRGIPGTVVLLLLLTYPWLQSGFTANRDYLFKSIAFAYAIFSLSDVPFEHLNTIYLYTISMTLLSYFTSEESGETE